MIELQIRELEVEQHNRQRDKSTFPLEIKLKIQRKMPLSLHLA